jgi:hypothetical protein
MTADTYFMSLFNRRHVCASLRTSEDESLLVIPFTQQEYERRAFRWWGSVLWNSVPYGIRKVTTLKEFHRMYTEYLMQRLSCVTTYSRLHYDFQYLESGLLVSFIHPRADEINDDDDDDDDDGGGGDDDDDDDAADAARENKALKMKPKQRRGAV